MERPKRNAQKLPDPDFISDFVETTKRLSKGEKRQSLDDDLVITKSPKLEKQNGVSPSKVRSPKVAKDKVKSPKVKSPKPKAIRSMQPVGVPLMRAKYSRSLLPDAAINTDGGKNTRRCGKSGCPVVRPICSVGIVDTCVGSRYTPRWYHISKGEHYCNDCFEHVYRRGGAREFSQWKRAWVLNGKSEASIRVYMADQCLPYWLRCNKCTKWRQLSRQTNVTLDFIRQYQCGMTSQGVKKEGNQCELEEDERVAAVNDPMWLLDHVTALYLQHSPAAPFLAHYYPDRVGMSAYTHVRKAQNGTAVKTESDDSDFEDDDLLIDSNRPKPTLAEDPEVEGSNPHIQPFDQPFMTDRAQCCRPDAMSPDEEAAFPHHARKHSLYVMYLALRNLTLAMWSLDYKEWLTVEKCIPHIICRGLLRIKCVLELPDILRFLTLKGYINTGFVNKPDNFHLFASKPDVRVIVVGAGPAGIAAAHHLHRTGATVTVLEAQDRLGGRVWDDHDMGLCVGRGAQIVEGCINNPIALLCDQLDLPMKKITEKCDLMTEEGKIIEPHIDNRIDFHFNAMLDNIAEWRKDKDITSDVNLLEKIQDMHKQFIEESQLTFSQEELQLLQFHISNLEYACGCNLKDLSALHWDQNEAFPQFGGHHALIQNGYSQILAKLAQNIRIQYSTEVTCIDYSGPHVLVFSKSGHSFMADKVIVTVPLSLLKKETIKFNPVLPQEKRNAIEKIGTGLIEKVAMQFPCRFWEKKVSGADFFGHIQANEEERGLFSVFYDMSPKQSTDGGSCSGGVLMTYVSGPALQLLQKLSDEEVKLRCLEVLRKLFPEEDVPEPINFFVTRWHDNQFAQMSYCYLPVGCSGEEINTLAKEVDHQIYFAGEATNHQFTQTVTGAYLSGIREADKILAPLIVQDITQ